METCLTEVGAYGNSVLIAFMFSVKEDAKSSVETDHGFRELWRLVQKRKGRNSHVEE